MATIASIFTLKLENKDFNAQLQTAAKSSQDYNNKIANSLLEAAKQEAKLVTLLKEKSELQASGSKAAVALKNQEIAATKSLIQAENASIKNAERNIAIQVEGAKRIIAADKAVIQSKEQVAKSIGGLGIQSPRGGDKASGGTSTTTRESLRSGFDTTFGDTTAQAKYTAQVQELNSLKAQGIISEKEYATAIQKTNDALKQGEPIRDNQFNHMIRMLRWAGTLAAAFYGVKTAWDATIGTGIEAAAQFEEMNIGIAALIATNSTNVTAMGKHVTASEKFAMAQKEAANAVILLRKANIDTPATLEQVTKGFQAALGPALGLGLNIKQTVEYARLMTIAAMSMRVPMEQLSQETRSILEGSIDQNSIVAKNLNITKAQMDRHKEQGDLYEWLIKKLSDFNSAGDAVNKSWSGVTSDLTDSWRAFTADFVKDSGIFNGLKGGLADLSKLLKNQNGEMDKFTQYIPVVEGLATALTVMWGASKSALLYETALNAIRTKSTVTTTEYSMALMRNVTVTTELTLAQTSLAFASELVSTAIKAVPFIAVTALVTSLATSFFDASRESDALTASLNQTADTLTKLTKNQLAFREASIQSAILEKGLELRQAKQRSISQGLLQSDLAYKEELANVDALKQEYADLLKAGEQIREFKAKGASKEVSKPTVDTLVSKPHEKTAEELEKERKKRDAELAKQNREDIKSYELKKSLIEAAMAMQGRQTVEAEVKANVDEKVLRERFAYEFKLQDIRKERFDDEVASAKKELGNEETRKNKIALLEKGYETDRKEFMIWELSQQKKIDDEAIAGLNARSIAARKMYEYSVAEQMREVGNIKQGLSFIEAFGKGKLSQEQVSSQLQAEARKFTKARFETESYDEFQKVKEKHAQAVDAIKDKLAEIPDIELKLKVTGVDDLTNTFATIANSLVDLGKVNDEYATHVSEAEAQIASDKKAGLDTTDKELKLSKLRTQNEYDTIAAYQEMAGVMSGAFDKGSKEAAAFTLVQQDLAMVNAVNAVAVASASSPWTGLATGAAMVAFLAPMLSNIGVVLGMGGTSTSSDAFSAMAANEGKGSTLGDTSKGSESISKSLSIMSDLAKPEYRLMTDMTRSLNSIDAKIGGVTSLLIRQGGFAMGEGYSGFDTGYSNNIGLGKVGTQAGGAAAMSGAALGMMYGPIGAYVGAIAGAALGPILAKIPIIGDLVNFGGGLVSSALGGVFGKSSVSQTMTDSGVYFADALLKNAVDTFEGSAYQTISTTVSKKSWFSKSSSTSISTYFAGLNDEVERQFSLVLGSLYDTTLLAGKALDTSASSIDTSLSNFIVSVGKVSLMGKTGTQIQESLSAIFGKIGDDIAKTVFPALIPFQKVGEGLFETMTRVSAGMEEAGYYISRLGQTYQDVIYTSLANKQGDVALEALRQSILGLEGTSNGVSQIIQGLTGKVSELYDTYRSLDKLRYALTTIGTSSDSLTSSMLYGAGGVQALEDATQSYMENFLTKSEQVTYQAGLMAKEFTGLGMTIPTTKQGFTALLKGIDVSTASGQELYGRLILLSSGFSDLTDSITTAFKDITDQAQNLSDAFISMSNSIQDTIDKLLSTAAGSSQSAMIGSFWDKRAQADVLLAKRGDLTVKEQQTLQALVNDIDSLAVSIQGAQVGSTGSITSSLVGQLQDLKSSVNIDQAIVQSRILDANGQVTNVATEGTLTRLANAMAERNAMLGIDGSHANGLDYVPFDGYVAQLHKGERVLTAAEANGFGGRTIVNFNTSALEAINNKIYDKISLMYNILNDAQLGSRPLYVKAQSYDTFRMS